MKKEKTTFSENIINDYNIPSSKSLYLFINDYNNPAQKVKNTDIIIVYNL